jgi:hypothetical protein
MNSFTDTTGFMTGAVCCICAAGGGVDERDEEQATALTQMAAAVTSRADLLDMLLVYHMKGSDPCR